MTGRVPFIRSLHTHALTHMEAVQSRQQRPQQLHVSLDVLVSSV